MKTFSPILKQLYEKLDLPQPEKSRVILEVAADMEDTYQNYIDQGLSVKKSIDLTRDQFQFDDISIHELNQIHQTGLQKLLSKFSDQARSWWERAALILILMFIILFSGQVILTKSFLLETSRFVWPILGIGIIMMILALVKFYEVFIKRKLLILKIRSNLFILLFLGGAGLIIGLYGFLYETFRALNECLYHLDDAFSIMVHWLYKSSAMIITSFWIFIISAILWYILNHRIIKLEIAETSCLIK